jgi:hypothetical protein
LSVVKKQHNPLHPTLLYKNNIKGLEAGLEVGLGRGPDKKGKGSKLILYLKVNKKLE